MVANVIMSILMIQNFKFMKVNINPKAVNTFFINQKYLLYYKIKATPASYNVILTIFLSLRWQKSYQKQVYLKNFKWKLMKLSLIKKYIFKITKNHCKHFF